MSVSAESGLSLFNSPLYTKEGDEQISSEAINAGGAAMGLLRGLVMSGAVAYGGASGLILKRQRPQTVNSSTRGVGLAAFKSYGAIGLLNVRRGAYNNTGSFIETDQTDQVCRTFLFGSPAAWSTVWPTLTAGNLIPVVRIGSNLFCLLTFGDTC